MRLQAPPAWTFAPPSRRTGRCSSAPENGRWCRPAFIFEVPAGYEAQIRPRSGLAFKNGITCLNTPGTIDSDYRGEVKVLLINLGDEDFLIERGMRIAQMVIAPVTQVAVLETTDASDTARGAGGFGSTGV